MKGIKMGKEVDGIFNFYNNINDVLVFIIFLHFSALKLTPISYSTFHFCFILFSCYVYLSHFFCSKCQEFLRNDNKCLCRWRLIFSFFSLSFKSCFFFLIFFVFIFILTMNSKGDFTSCLSS